MKVNAVKIKDNIVLQPVSIYLNKSLLFVAGSNGTGKTTLLKVLSRIDFIEKYADYSFSETDFVLGEKAAFLDFEFNLNWLSFKDLMSFTQMLYKTNVSDDFSDCYEQLGLKHVEGKKFRELSLGSKKKAIVSCAIFSSKPIILLDEPFENLDEKSIGTLAYFIKKKLIQNKKFIISIHNKNILTNFHDYEILYL